MKDKLLTLNVRRSLVQYALDQLHVATTETPVVNNQITANLILQNSGKLTGLIK